MNLSRRRAIVLAMYFQGFSVDQQFDGIEAAQSYWKSEVISQGLTAPQADRIMEVDSSSFEKEILKGDFVTEVNQIADPALLRWHATTLEELEASVKTKGRRAPAASTASASEVPPAEPGQFDSLPAGTKVTIHGKSWEGFVARIEADDGTHYQVSTVLKKGSVWNGKVRKSAIKSVVE